MKNLRTLAFSASLACLMLSDAAAGTRLRGADSGTGQPSSLDELASWNANLIRVFYTYPSGRDPAPGVRRGTLRTTRDEAACRVTGCAAGCDFRRRRSCTRSRRRCRR